MLKERWKDFKSAFESIVVLTLIFTLINLINVIMIYFIFKFFESIFDILF